MAIPDPNRLKLDRRAGVETERTRSLRHDLSDTDATESLERLPERVDRYEVRRLLGSGGFGRVYLAFDPVIRRDVALKVPGRVAQWSEGAEQAFWREAQRAARLRHPHVVTIYDAGVCPEHGVFIVMEYVDGETLSERLVRSDLSLPESVDLVMQVGSAMHAAHKQGLVHRDLKPSNIMLDREGDARVTDFGLALLEEAQGEERGLISGTLPYMSPEQITGQAHLLDGRSDIWSLGVVLYLCLTGRRPFAGENLDELREEILQREPKPPRQINDHISTDLEEICLRCLAKPISQRFRTARDLADALSTLPRLSSAEHAVSVPDSAPVLLETGSSSPEASTVLTAPVSSGIRGRWGGRHAVLGLFLVTVLAALAVAGMLRRSDTVPDVADELPAINQSDVPSDDAGTRPVPSVAGRWYPLLDRTPRKLVWSDSMDANFNPDPNRRQVSVSSVHPAVLEVGTVPDDSFRLEVWVVRSAWLGSSGLMWGVPDDVALDGKPSFSAQVLHIYSFVSTTGHEHRVQRDFLTFRAAPRLDAPLMDRYAFLSQTVPAPDSAEVRLEVTVRDGAVSAVLWDGKRLDSLCDRVDLPPPVTVAAGGKVCLYNEYGTALFRDARLQLLP